MSWFNCYGLLFIAVILIPNIIYALTHKHAQPPQYRNRALETIEQIGRYTCMLFMVFNVPFTAFGFWFPHALVVYLAANGVLCLTYCVFWVLCWRKNSGYLRALSLSVLPTAVFLSSGILLSNIPLTFFAVLFGVAHITISYKNA